MTLVVHSIDKAFHLLNKLMDLVVHGYEFNDVVHSKLVRRRLFSLHVYNSVYVHSKPMSLIMLCVTLYQVLLFYISSFFFLVFSYKLPLNLHNILMKVSSFLNCLNNPYQMQNLRVNNNFRY